MGKKNKCAKRLGALATLRCSDGLLLKAGQPPTARLISGKNVDLTHAENVGQVRSAAAAAAGVSPERITLLKDNEPLGPEHDDSTDVGDGNTVYTVLAAPFEGIPLLVSRLAEARDLVKLCGGEERTFESSFAEEFEEALLPLVGDRAFFARKSWQYRRMSSLGDRVEVIWHQIWKNFFVQKNWWDFEKEAAVGIDSPFQMYIRPDVPDTELLALYDAIMKEIKIEHQAEEDAQEASPEAVRNSYGIFKNLRGTVEGVFNNITQCRGQDSWKLFDAHKKSSSRQASSSADMEEVFYDCFDGTPEQ